jgi:cobalt-zinc-cadmium resistance protein CzcA
MLEKDLSTLPGNNYEFTQPIQMRFNELISGVRSDLDIKVFGDDLDTLVSSATEILAVFKKINGVSDAHLEQVDDVPIFTVNLRRDEVWM